MSFEHVQVGDILFFSAPLTPPPNVIARLKAQMKLSLWSCRCCSEDYKLSHVAICIFKDSENIRIAHIRATKMPDYLDVSHNGFCIDNKRFMDEKFSGRKYFVLRPKDNSFATQLAHCAEDAKNSQINWSDEICERAHSFFSCCSKRKNPPNEFSRETICSRFVAEVVDNARGKVSCFDQANVCVMTLKRRLNKTELFDLIPQDELDTNHNRQYRSALITESTKLLD